MKFADAFRFHIQRLRVESRACVIFAEAGLIDDFFLRWGRLGEVPSRFEWRWDIMSVLVWIGIPLSFPVGRAECESRRPCKILCDRGDSLRNAVLWRV